MTREEMAATAAHWWANTLRDPKFDTLGPGRSENRPGDAPAGFAELMAKAHHKSPLDDQLAFFEKELRERLLIGNDIVNDRVYLGVDYSPDQILSETAVLAGFRADSLTFPWKTSMWLNFKEGTVRVRYGYGAEIQDLEPVQVDE